MDRLDRAVLTIDIEAADDDAAVELCCAHCVGAEMPVELSESDRHVIRMTPVAARVYLMNHHAREHQRL
jgi:hypothetical protein